jgi:hypothetical protein
MVNVFTPAKFFFLLGMNSLSTMGIAWLPLKRTMPNPPSPIGVEMAAIVSSVSMFKSNLSPISSLERPPLS